MTKITIELGKCVEQECQKIIQKRRKRGKKSKIQMTFEKMFAHHHDENKKIFLEREK